MFYSSEQRGARAGLDAGTGPLRPHCLGFTAVANTPTTIATTVKP